MSQRKKYSKEFKIDAINLVQEQGYSYSEAAKSLDIPYDLLNRWIRESKKSDKNEAFRGNGKLSATRDSTIKRRKPSIKNGERNIKKGQCLLCSGNEIKYLFIAEHKKVWPVVLMCQLFNVKRSGFYDYLKNRIHRKNELEAELIDWMKKISESSHFSYGSRRMTKALNALGYRIGRRKTRRLMKVAHIFVRYRKKYKVTTNSNHLRPIYENVLQRQFTVDQPNKAYVSDITYIWTQEGWLYLTVMIDLFSRKVVGWHMSSRMTADTVCMALNVAIGLRNPEKGLIVHSDRGSQYASQQYQSLLASHGFIGSMSRKGDCWDNSVAESFFSRLKDERVFWRNYQTRDEAKNDILNYILMFYNPKRLHSKLEYVSPQQFENNYWGVITKAA